MLITSLSPKLYLNNGKLTSILFTFTNSNLYDQLRELY